MPSGCCHSGRSHTVLATVVQTVRPPPLGTRNHWGDDALSDCTPSPRPCTVILAVPPPWRCRSVKSPVTALDCPPRLSGRSPSGPPPPRRRTTIFITSDAVEFFSQSAPATVLRNHPGTFHEWRIVAHVLIMAAFQLRHPVTFFIQMKSSDPSLHCRHATPAHPAPTAPRGAV